MINNQQANLEVEDIAGETEDIEASIAFSDLGMIFDILSSQLYKNPIGSTIREITTNAADANIEAGVADAVIVAKGEDDEGTYISIQDFGVGISPDRIKDVYMKIGSSTKRGTNEQTGYWGLGSKSPLAYTDRFYIISRFNNVEYQYILHKGARVPTLSLLLENETEERNGTTIKIYMKTESDINIFETEIIRQLAYFDNVYYVGFDISNDYSILEGEHFKLNTRNKVAGGVRNYSGYPDIHLVIGRVAYEIDYDEINMVRPRIPVAIKFKIGELPVTPSRESIRYTEEAKELIRERMRAVREELKTRFLAQANDSSTIFDYVRMRKKNKVLNFAYGEGKSLQIDVTDIIPSSDFKAKYTPMGNMEIKIPENPYFFLSPDREDSARNTGHKSCYRSITDYLTDYSAYRCTYLFDYETDITKTKALYLRSFTNACTAYIKIENLRFRTWCDKLDLSSYTLGRAKIIHRYKQAVLSDIYVSGVKHLKRVEISAEWMSEYRAKYRRKVDVHEGSILVHHVRNEGTREYPNYVLAAQSINLADLANYTGFIVYGNRENRTRLEGIEWVLRLRKTLSATRVKSPFYVIQVSTDKNKHFRNMKNACHVTKLTPEVRVLRDVVTAYRIRKIGIQWKNNFPESLEEYDSRTAERVARIIKFSNDNLYKFTDIVGHGVDLLEDMLLLAEHGDLWNKGIMDDVVQVEKFFTRLPLLKHFGNNELLGKIPKEEVIDYFKKSHARLNLNHYVSTLFLEPTEELTDEVVKVTDEPVYDEESITIGTILTEDDVEHEMQEDVSLITN